MQNLLLFRVEGKAEDLIKNKTITVKGTEIVLFSKGNDDYVSITDIARFKNAIEPKDVVKNWMRSRSTIEFLGLWEKYITRILKGSNSTPLCIRPAVMHLCLLTAK